MVQHYLETFNYYPAYSPDLVPSDLSPVFVETCFRGPHSLSGTSILTKASENGLMNGLLRKMKNFFGVVYTNYPKDGKNVVSEGKYFE